MIQMLPRLRAFGRSLTGTQDQADDLVQQTVEKALRNIESYTPGTRLDSWLSAILAGPSPSVQAPSMRIRKM